MIVSNGNPHGLIPRAEVLPGLAELISRCGSLYKVDRTYGQKYGLVENTLRMILRGTPEMVRRRTAWGIQQALSDQRRCADERPKPPRYHKPPRHFISRTEVLPFAQELIWRCGSPGLVEKKHGIPKSTLQQLVSRGIPNGIPDTSKVRYATAQRILTALSEQRRHDRQHGTSKRFRDTLSHRAMQEAYLRRDYGI